MTDRVRTLTVILDRDTRDDDVECTVAAIERIEGVSSVKLGKPVGFEDYIARQTAASEIVGSVGALSNEEIREQIMTILYPERKS